MSNFIIMSDQQQSFSIDLAEITSLLFANCNEKESRHAAQYGLSAVEFRCIRKLFEKGQLTVNQMAQELSLTSSRVTRIIDGLVDKNLVNRISGENDRRVFNLSLKPKGEKVAQESIKDHIKIHEEIIKNIPEEYHQSMIEILRKLNEAVKNWLEKY
jgi:DNA-binding MarR family transcriptional regulator